MSPRNAFDAAGGDGDRPPWKSGVLRVALLVGAVVGFGSGLHHLHHHRHAHADALTRVCVDAALGRDSGEDRGWHGHRARWVAERCAEHAQDDSP